MSILIITHSHDHEGVEQVMSHITDSGEIPIRLNTDFYPTEVKINYGAEDFDEKNTLIINDKHYILDDVTAIWYRRVAIGMQISTDLDPALRKPSIDESRQCLLSMLGDMDVFIMDEMYTIRRAENKLLQLRLAKELGMSVPKTLVSNEPEAVKRFIKTCDNGVIIKMMHSFAVYEDGKENVVFTSELQENDIEALDQLKYCPMTFQEKIAKHVELRVTVVGNEVYCASIDSQKSDKSKIDWRVLGAQTLDDWNKYTLPIPIQEKLIMLTNRLKLNYGAADFIVTPAGEYVFLEINPCGEFYWLEKNTGFPLTKSIADVLLGKNRRQF